MVESCWEEDHHVVSYFFMLFHDVSCSIMWLFKKNITCQFHYIDSLSIVAIFAAGYDVICMSKLVSRVEQDRLFSYFSIVFMWFWMVIETVLDHSDEALANSKLCWKDHVKPNAKDSGLIGR